MCPRPWTSRACVATWAMTSSSESARTTASQSKPASRQLSSLVMASLSPSRSPRKPRVRRVEVEEARRPDRPKAVDDMRRRGHVGAFADAHRFTVHQELDLAVEHEERVDLVVVRVRVDAFPALVERHLEHRELCRLRPDHVLDQFALQPLATVRPGDDRTRRPVRLVHVDTVPGDRDVVVDAPTDVLDEAAVRCVDVEVVRAVAPRAEPMDDPGRHRDSRPRPRAQRLGAVEELEFALEDVERIDVLLVEVGAGTLEVRTDPHLVDRDLRPLELHDDPVAEPLALAGS